MSFIWIKFADNIFDMVYEKSTSESDFSVIKGKSDSNVLPLSINERCFAKNDTA